jgi:hypothetical protein
VEGKEEFQARAWRISGSGMEEFREGKAPQGRTVHHECGVDAYNKSL